MAIEFKKLFPGKLESGFLDSLLRKYAVLGPEVTIGPAIGEDATAIEWGDKYLLVKTDPITFITQEIGYYAVHVNANDIVCMGGEPRWFLATLLLPKGVTKEAVEQIFSQIADECGKENISFCGGHTEVTFDFTRPVVVGVMLGEVSKAHLLQKRHILPNDRIVQVQPVPLEGASIIARIKAAKLQKLYSNDFVSRCSRLLYEPGISVRPYAQIAQQSAFIRALHDPTEGGLATALHELAFVSGLGIEIRFDSILFLPEGKLLCDHFEMDPLGCLASGSLLVVAPYDSVASLLITYEQLGISAAEIGRFTPDPKERTLVSQGIPLPLPTFSRDEITKIL